MGMNVFQNKVKTVVLELNRLRKEGKPVTLSSYLEQKFNKTPADLYAELGIDPNTTTVEMMWNISTDTQWIMPEIIRSAIIVGMRRRKFEEYIIAASQQSSSKIQEFPFVDFSDMTTQKAKKRTPAASFKEYTFEVGTKYVGSEEYGVGMKFPYTFNTIKKLKLNVLPLYFQAFGIQLHNRIMEKVIEALLTGDGGVTAIKGGTTVDQTPMEIGVQDSGSGIQEADFLRGIIEMELAGKPATTMIATVPDLMNALTWPCFKDESFERQGKTKIKPDIVYPIPTRVTMIPSKSIGTKMILLSKEFCIVEFIYQALLVEADKIISKKLEEAYASIDVGYANVLRSARLVINPATTFNENQLLDWFYY
jgi:hypothetical protein